MQLAVLTVPALLLAGLASSPHCLLMCGSLQTLQARGQTLRWTLLWLNLGRIAGYALLGATAGGIGAALLPRLPSPTLGAAVQLLSGLVLLLLGLSYLRRSLGSCGGHPAASAARVLRPSFLRLLWRGLLWSMLPCGLLYGVLFLAAASGGTLMGMMLMAAFGLGTAPLLLLGGGALRRLLAQSHLRLAAAVLLIAMGAGSISLVLGAEYGSDWCRSAIASSG